MGNQQGKTDTEMLSWIAGFLDADGHIIIGRGVKGKDQWVPLVGITNTHYPTLSSLTEMLDHLGLPYYVAHRDRRDGNLRQWHLRATGFKRVDKWCRALLPYLITKQEKAEMLIEYINLLMAPGRYKNKYAERSSRELELIHRMRRTPGKRRGPKVSA